MWYIDEQWTTNIWIKCAESSDLCSDFYHDFAALEVEIHVSAIESYGSKPLHSYTPEN